MKNALEIFKEKTIRKVWDEKTEKWYFSVVDVINVLTESQDPRNYWKVLKKRLIDEGSNQTVTNCNQLKLRAEDGKMRLTDVADTETIFRLIRSIPSSNAEPFKLWLAKVGYERVEETVDPELVLTMLAETATTEISKEQNSKEFIEHREVAKESGEIAGTARKQIKKRTGKKVIQKKNATLSKSGH